MFYNGCICILLTSFKFSSTLIMFDKDKVAQPIDSCIEFITTTSYIFKRMHNHLYVGV